MVQFKLNPKYQKIWKLAEPYQDFRKDIGHGATVTYFAQKICETEQTNPDVVIPAAILHDTGWSRLTEQERMLIFDKTIPLEERLKMRYRHQEESVRLADEILNQINYPQELISQIKSIVSEHDTREGFISDDEGAMRDADKLWRFDQYGFLNDNKNSGISFQNHIKALYDYFEKPNFFYFDSSEKLARDLLKILESKFIRIAEAIDTEYLLLQIQNIAWGISALKDKFIKDQAKINYVTVFAQSQAEYEAYTKAATELGMKINEHNGNVYKFNSPLEFESGTIKLFRIRQFDPDRPQVGCGDFSVNNYAEFKANHPELRLIQREDFEMLELTDPRNNYLVYFPSETITDYLQL